MLDSNRYIFLVDDDEDYHYAFLEILKGFKNHYLETSLNGKDALAKLNAAPSIPDLIILDINMPGMNGFECLTTIKKITRLKDIPIVIYSSSTLKCSIETSQSLGAIGYIVKPEYSTDIKEKFQALLRKHFQQTDTNFSTNTFFVVK